MTEIEKSSYATPQMKVRVTTLVIQSNNAYKGSFATIQDLLAVSAFTGDYADVFETKTRWQYKDGVWTNTGEAIPNNPDYVIVDNVSVFTKSNTLVQRDDKGHAYFADPESLEQGTTKGYVDNADRENKEYIDQKTAEVKDYVDEETSRAKTAEGVLTDAIEEEVLRAKSAESVNAENISKNTSSIEDIKELIPETAETAVETAKAYTDNNAASSLEFVVDNSTFVLTATLKNANGEILGTPQTVDLPLESVVVGGRYENETKSVVLTLQNGNTVNIPVADLVEGLATTSDLENYVKKSDIDSTLSDTSENPVQNKVIKSALDNNVDEVKLYVDDSLPAVISEDMADSLF